MVQPGDFDHASDLVKDLAYNKSSCADPVYLAKVRDAIVEAVVAANEARVVGTAGFGSGREDTVAFNRRIRMKNGLSFLAPGQGEPRQRRVCGPHRSRSGRDRPFGTRTANLVGCVVNFACHATTSGPWISANWIHYMEKAIQGFYGAETRVVFWQGACGDVTQVNNLDPHANPEGDAWAQLVGRAGGAEALKVLVGLFQVRTADVPIAIRSKTWRIPRACPRRNACRLRWNWRRKTRRKPAGFGQRKR